MVLTQLRLLCGHSSQGPYHWNLHSKSMPNHHQSLVCTYSGWQVLFSVPRGPLGWNVWTMDYGSVDAIRNPHSWIHLCTVSDKQYVRRKAKHSGGK